MSGAPTESSLNAKRWKRMETIFHAAVEKTGEQRRALLDEFCGNDHGLRAEVERILAAHEQDDAHEPHGAARTPEDQTLFGPYRTEREIGFGGMGTVYLAHRADGQFEQRVALKLVSRHLRTEFFTQRFLTERQILAQLRHPNITGLLDGGVSAQGDPYLVMEYVEGQGLFEYCNARVLSVRERVRLCLSICSAVDFAHRNLVVHRDLKPSNILVTDDGVPKLLDFGTAKLLDLAAERAATTQMAMTPRYASPEQLRGEPVSTVSDVFSLGVVVYELLTGVWPFGDPGSVLAGLERALEEIEPARPSSVITGEAARARGESHARLGRILDGDLRAVLNKAMAWDPRRRYTSVEQFSADLKRWLDDLPVQAQQQTLGYRAGRYLHRNGKWLAAAIAVFAVLAGAAFVAVRESALSQQRLAQARELSDFYLNDVLREVENLPGSVKARLLIVERAQRDLDGLLKSAPGDATLSRELAVAYLRLGDIQGKPFTVSVGDASGALASYRKAELLSSRASASDFDQAAVRLRARTTIGLIQSRLGQYESAIKLLGNAVESARQLTKKAPSNFTSDGLPPLMLEAEANRALGYALLRKEDFEYTEFNFQRAASQLRLALGVGERAHAAFPNLPDPTGRISEYLGFALEGLGEFTGERGYYRESSDAHRRAAEVVCGIAVRAPKPQTDRDCGDALGEWSWALHNAGEGAAAVDAAQQALTRMTAIAGAESNSAEAQHDLATAFFHLGAAENTDGRFRDAARDLLTAESRIAPAERVPPDDPLSSIQLRLNVDSELADALDALGNRAAALRQLRAAIALAEARGTAQKGLVARLRKRLSEIESGAKNLPKNG
jgi:non-specific serine/threonine protein kinase/serine/threonine-protein kinase